MANDNYRDLFRQRGFVAYLASQFLGAFNDNVSKWIIIFYAMHLAAGQGSLHSSVANGLFVIPFLLFSSWAGYLADVHSKRTVMVLVKVFEVAAMGLGFFAIVSGSLPFMFVIPFLMGLHATFFSPAKYGIVPEILPEKDLSRANGVLEMTTFMAIVLGTSLGITLFDHWQDQPGRLNLLLVAIAVAGLICSLRVPKTRVAAAPRAFPVNPFAEAARGIRELRARPVLWQTALGISYFWFLGAFLLSVLAPFGKEVMGLADAQTGLLETALAVGIGVGSLVAGKLSGDKVELGLVPLGSIGMGILACLVFQFHGYGVVLALLAALGFCGGFFAVPLNALLQQKSGANEKGRIIATNNFMNAVGMVLASVALILCAEVFHLTPDQSILAVGILTFGVTAYLLLILPDFLVRFCLWMFTHTVYRIRMVGQQHVPARGPALLVCNHVSLVDGLLVGASIQRFVRFMVWKPYYEHRAFHWLFKLMKAIPVGSSRQEMLDCLERAREELQAGHVVCIFAEGAISRTGNMLPFKRGLERIMEGVDAPIVPVHLDRLWGSIFSFKDGKFVLKMPRRVPFPVTISYGAALPSTCRAEQVRQAVQELASDAVAHRKSRKDSLPYRFLQTAHRNRRSLALADSSGKELTYGRSLIAALMFAGWVKRNCRDQQMVGLLLPASVGGALANLGVSLTGKIPVNLNFTAGGESLAAAVSQCGIRTILTSKVFIAKAGLETMQGMVYLEDLLRGFGSGARVAAVMGSFLPASWLRRLLGLHRVKPDDLATVVFSSGSTGNPKGVMLTHFNVLTNVQALEQLFWVTKRDRILGVLPFFHSFGFTGTLWFPLVAGFGAAYHPNPLDARTIGELCRKQQASIFISTPTFFATYCRKVPKEDFASLRFAVVGAEKLRDQLAADFREKYGLDLMEGYGCTEMAPVVAVNVPDYLQGRLRQKGLKPGTVGHPLPGVAVRIVHPDTGAALGSNEAGLLLVKGPNRMAGYLGQPEKTAEVVRDGWYVTGDIAVVDEDGFLRITDRLSRFSKIGGEMVPHLKVEEALQPFLGEHGCAVSAVADEQKGERLVVLYTHPQMQAAELWEKLAATGLPKLWLPKKDCFHFLESLPLLGTGKLDLRGLKKAAEALNGAGKT